MTVKNLLIINAIFAGLLALFEIVAPAAVLQTFGQDVNGGTEPLMRLLGATTIGYAIASWLMRYSGPSTARRAFLIGGGIGYVVVALVVTFNRLSGLGNSMGWVTAVISALFAVGFLYFGLRPDAA